MSPFFDSLPARVINCISTVILVRSSFTVMSVRRHRFYHAHHFADTLVGLTIGFLWASMVETFGRDRVGMITLLLLQVVVIVVFGLVHAGKKKKKKKNNEA